MSRTSVVVLKVVALALTAAPVLAGGGGQRPTSPDAAQQREFADLSPTAGLRRLVHYRELRALRTFFERVDVSTAAAGVSRPDSGTLGMAGVLGRIGGEWEAPFEFVRAAIAYSPYTGSVRGAAGVIESGAGNAIDQALLLRAIMEARGIPTRLMRGRLEWLDAARLVTGSTTPQAPRADDPWPRWLEGAADHWWVQAEREGVWVDLDPSFADATVGAAVGLDGVPHDTIPVQLKASVRVELRRGELVVAEADFESGELVGASIHLRLEAQSEAAVRLWEQSEIQMEVLAEAAWRFADGLGLIPRPRRVPQEDDPAPGIDPRSITQPETSPADRGAGSPEDPQAAAPTPAGRGEDLPRRPSDFQRLFLDPGAGPWLAQVEVPGRVLEAGPFAADDLDSLQLHVAVRPPFAPEQVVQMPWQGSPAGQLSVVITAGNVSVARLESEAMPIYRGLGALAATEMASRDAMRPPTDYHDAATALRAATIEGWARFAVAAPEALGWAVLYGTDRVAVQSPAGQVVRQGLRLAAVRWSPPDETRDGSLAVVLNDPVTVGNLTGIASAASLRAAYGLLQSAVLSQVMNRLAERAPATAFDATLMAIGTGADLVTFGVDDGVPSTWPPAARARAADGLQAGYAMLAPSSLAGAATPGWWQVGVADGETVGWVVSSNTVLQGSVQLGAAAPPDELDSLLASLPVLHRASRWLASLPGSGMSALSSASIAACGSAAVVADAMNSGLPAGWPRPDVLSFCDPR